MNWIEDGAHAELKYIGAEVKNGKPVMVAVLGDDAKVLWNWQTIHRHRFMVLRGIERSPYLFPGTATPRLQNTRLALPTGCMSVAAQAELWDIGERQIGLGLTPHQCRHAIATLHLAVHPGDYATVASILCNTEEVARRHYGKDSGQEAAERVRSALLARHPDLFKRMQRRP